MVGHSNGTLARYNSDANLIWQQPQAHEGEVRQLCYDPKNRLVISLGAEGKIAAWPERNPHL